VYKVLLVDDEPLILDGMTRIIDWGHYLCAIAGRAGSAEEALALCAADPPDLVVTDVKMPGQDGLWLIEQIRRQTPETRCVVLSGHEDFAFVKRGIQLGIDNYLLKPVNRLELEQTLEMVVSRIESAPVPTALLRENVLLRWAQGRIGEEELRERGRLLGLDLKAPMYRAALVCPPEGDEEKLRARLDTLGPGVAAEPGGRFLVVFGGTVSAVDDQVGALTAVVEAVPGACGALGAPVTSALDLAESLADAEDLLRYRLVAPGAAVLDAQAGHRARTGVPPVAEFDRRLVETALVTPRETVADAVRQWLADLVALPQILPEQLQKAAVQAVLAAGGPEDNAPLLERLYRCRTLAALGDVVETALQHEWDRRHRTSTPLSPLVQGVIDWIHSHSEEELSLKTLSQRFRLNPTYLGQKFHQETGFHFSPYLAELRIKKARYLLETTHLKAGEVGLRVGFSDPGYFFRIFRDLTGQSPTEYRKTRMGSGTMW